MYDDSPKRTTIEIAGSPRVVDTIVTLMRYIEACGRLGTTRRVELMVDGDGGAQIAVTVDGAEVPLAASELDFLFEGAGEGTPALRQQVVETRPGDDGTILVVELV